MINTPLRVHALISKKVFSVLLLAMPWGCLISSAAGLTGEHPQVAISDSTPPIELRGYFLFNGEPSFSLRDLETGSSWWMHLGQERFGFKLEAFNQIEKEITISWNNQREIISLKKFENSGSLALSASIELSPINQKVYGISEKLIKTTRSEETGRLIKDHREVQKLRGFLAQNPSVSALHDFLPALGDALDYEEFLKIEFPKGVQSRNKQNTPRWGIDKSLDLADIEKLIASNPSQSELDAALIEK